MQLTLRQAEALLQARNLELQLGRAALAGATAEGVVAAQRPNPSLSLNALSISPSSGIGSGRPWDKQVDTTLRLDQLIERGGKRELRTSAAQMGIAASRSDLAERERQQRVALYAAYYDLVLAQQRERVGLENFALCEQSLNEVGSQPDKLFSADYSRINIDRLKALNDVRQARAEREKAQLILAYSLGIDGDARRIEVAVSWPGSTQAEQVRSPEAILEMRHDVRAALARLGAAVKTGIWRAPSGPGMRMSPNDEGFSDVTIGGERRRTYSRWDDNSQYLVQVGEHYSLRDESAEAIAGHVMHPMLVALPILAALVWFAIGAGLIPLGRRAAEVGRRAPDNLVPLEEKAVPREVMPLLVAINRLSVRLAASIEQERRFTADAAHELRTPLAAVKVHAQVALWASNDDERRRALGQIVTGTNRVACLLEQLLTLARLDPQIVLVQTQKQTVSLSELASEYVADLVTTASAKTVELRLRVTDDGVIAGDRALLAILLRNLVDNAVRYTQPGGEIEVAVVREKGAATLRVTDDGPGIPQTERTRVFERF